MNGNMLVRWGAALGLALALALPAAAQAGRGWGRLGGTVKDDAGRPVAGAKVVLEHSLGFRGETKTDAKGGWGINGLGHGYAVVRVTAEGFRAAVAQALVRQLTGSKPLTIFLKARDAGPNVPAAASMPPKSVRLHLYMVIASRRELATAAEDKDLERVLAELKEIMSLRSFRLAGQLTLLLQEGESCDILLSARPLLRCSIDDVLVASEPDGRRKVAFRMALDQTRPDGNGALRLLESRTEVYDKGNLAAGVSKWEASDSLVLVFGAEIQ